MKEFHAHLNELLEQAGLLQQTLEEVESAIPELEDRLGQLTWQRQETLRKLREIIRRLAVELED